MGYTPKTEYERTIFPNLGRVKIIRGPERYIGREGTIIHITPDKGPGLKRGVVRVAFDDFWNRPDDANDEVKSNDNSYFFKD